MEPFIKCTGCGKILYTTEFENNMRVCMHCNRHHRLGAHERIAITFDENSFEEMDAELTSKDPLGFPEYAEKLASSVAKTKTNDSIISGMAKLDSRLVSVAISDFNFMGGSMGSVAGEKIARTLERACERKVPAIIFCASGGARMQEGLYSLMTLPKTTAAVNACNEAGVPYIAVFTDPTMAGVLASYASIADVILAEPGSLVGFAGARVAKQAGVSRVPDDFQTAEFALRSGMLDKIVPRKELRTTLITLTKILGGRCYDA